MKFLSAPWRWNFITKKFKNNSNCVFCDALKHSEESLVCYTGKEVFVILNKFPYNSGHLMIVPNKHTSSPVGLAPEVSAEMWKLQMKSIEVLKKCFNPDGFNIGMNIGKAAGAGIEEHCHMHIVPRWTGDANFMSVVGGTDVQSFDIGEIRKIIVNEFNKME